jgi:hypothetical protein
MTISRFTPPLDYLQAASRSSLQSFELARLNHAANLRNEIATLIDQWITESCEAMLARWMLDNHQSLQSSPINPTDLVRSLIDPAATLFPDPASTTKIVPASARYSHPPTTLKSALTRKPQKQRHPAAG